MALVRQWDSLTSRRKGESKESVIIPTRGLDSIFSENDSLKTASIVAAQKSKSEAGDDSPISGS